MRRAKFLRASSHRPQLAFEPLETRELLAADAGYDWWSEAWEAPVIEDWSASDDAWAYDVSGTDEGGWVTSWDDGWWIEDGSWADDVSWHDGSWADDTWWVDDVSWVDDGSRDDTAWDDDVSWNSTDDQVPVVEDLAWTAPSGDDGGWGVDDVDATDVVALPVPVPAPVPSDAVSAPPKPDITAILDMPPFVTTVSGGQPSADPDEPTFIAVDVLVPDVEVTFVGTPSDADAPLVDFDADVLPDGIDEPWMIDAAPTDEPWSEAGATLADVAIPDLPPVFTTVIVNVVPSSPSVTAGTSAATPSSTPIDHPASRFAGWGAFLFQPFGRPVAGADAAAAVSPFGAQPGTGRPRMRLPFRPFV